MDKISKRFHRLRYLVGGETILYEPKLDHFVWLVMYIPPNYRGYNIPKTIFNSAIKRFLGIHHIHCSKRITSFKKLSTEYNWEYKGHSKYFEGCSYFRFNSTSPNMHTTRDFQIKYKIQQTRPTLKTFWSKMHANHAIELIDQDVDDLK